MHHSIPPVPIPPGNPGAFVQVLCPGGGAFAQPVASSREFDTPGFKTVKTPGRQVACFIRLRLILLWEKVWILLHSGFSAKY